MRVSSRRCLQNSYAWLKRGWRASVSVENIAFEPTHIETQDGRTAAVASTGSVVLSHAAELLSVSELSLNTACLFGSDNSAPASSSQPPQQQRVLQEQWPHHHRHHHRHHNHHNHRHSHCSPLCFAHPHIDKRFQQPQRRSPNSPLAAPAPHASFLATAPTSFAEAAAMWLAAPVGKRTAFNAQSYKCVSYYSTSSSSAGSTTGSTTSSSARASSTIGAGGGAKHTRGGQEGSSEGRQGGGGGPGAQQPLPLSAALRLLYKRVHPDLHDHPRAKAENERSFKLLQEYVALARGGDARSPAARLPYRFVFYMREQPQAVPAAEATEDKDEPAGPATPPVRPPARGSTAAAPPQQRGPLGAEPSAASGAGGEEEEPEAIPGLHRVAVTLPPPAISAADAKLLAGPTRKALTKLLAACGLPTTGKDVAEGAEGGEDGEEEAGGPLSLAAFLPEAVEALRQAEAARPSDPAVRVANLRGAMRLHRQVMVSFSDKQLAPKTQVTLLERLARVLEAAPELELQGCHIVIGDRLGLDRLGHLCLAASEPDDAWAAFLSDVDIPFVRNQRKTVQAIRSLESQVAQATGLAQVFTTYGNLTEMSYRQFLERLASLSAAKGPICGGEFRQVSLCVLAMCSVPPQPPQEQQQQQGDGTGLPPPPPAHGCRLDASSPGVVQASSDLSAEQVYAGVAALGADALAAVRVRRHVEAQLRELMDKTRLRLRLRSLTTDPRVSADHVKRACGLMLNQAAALTPLLEGCSVRVGFANRLAPDGSCIEIAYNCQL